jgi:hypothetical protein
MLSFYDFINEEDSEKTKVQKIKLDLAKKFDEISISKGEKKPDDLNSEIKSIDKQAALYMEISNMMKLLSVEIKKAGTTKKSTNIY